MHRIAVLILLGLALGLPGSTSAQAPAKDERRAVALTEPTLVYVLTEMRNLMDALQSVMEAAGKGDWDKAAAAADKSGMKAAKAHAEGGDGGAARGHPQDEPADAPGLRRRGGNCVRQARCGGGQRQGGGDHDLLQHLPPGVSVHTEVARLICLSD